MLNLGLILFSIIIVTWFRDYVRRHYGRLSSISVSAKHLQRDGKQIYFYIFIVLGICFPLTYVANTWITTFAAMFLFGIGIITGWNPDLVYKEEDEEIKYKDIQGAVHVILTFLAILGFAAGMIVMNPWLAIVIGITFIPCFILWIKQAKDHTRRIEGLIIYAMWTCLIIDKILIGIILKGIK